MRPALFILLLAAVVLGGCAQRIQQPAPLANQDAAMREPPVETYEPRAIRSEGSIFSEDARMDLFADMKARRVGDIVTINIVENSNASKNVNTALGRSSSIEAQTDALLGLEDPRNIPGIGKAFKAMKINGLGIDTSYDSSFSGSGSTNRNENMTATMSARVIQVLPNGNLVLRGSQEIMVNNEKQYITIQGVVRPTDIAADNTVLSTYMADARIDYTGEGDLSRKQRQGWLARFFDTIWPF